MRILAPAALLLHLAVFAAPAPAADQPLLWQIGKPDRDDAEFALAPRDYARFDADGFYVVGRSDPARDWPYAQPGPVDAWGGGRPHTFTVVFALEGAPKSGECRLRLGVIDTQAAAPPKLVVRINGHDFNHSLEGGAGDASIQGNPAAGRPRTVEIGFPAGHLVAGDNHLQITTVSGSWLVYDWLGLQAPADARLGSVQGATVVDAIQPVRAVREAAGRLMQPLQVRIRHFDAPADAQVRVEGIDPVPVRLDARAQTVTVEVPAVERDTPRQVAVEVGGRAIGSQKVVLQPVKHLTVYVLPHSHTDIGYTEIQSAVEAKQMENLRKGMEYARRTAAYPEGARFVWNVEVLWAADLFLNRMSEADRAAFFQAVKSGQVVLNGMYLNELTGLCRPEELIRLFRYATELGRQTGVPVDSAMISDVPGYTWGLVTAMSQAGIRYFSTAPNYFDRIGDILQKWENKPFWWVGPSGKERVLVWIPYKGYAMSHVYDHLSSEFVTEYQGQLERMSYPYDIAYMRWSGHGDNAEPDPAICEFVKDWNTKYRWPHFVISGTGEAFRAFEKQYGSKLPEVRGDWTPYWEDGAGSSALETGLNRDSSDRVTQAEALYAVQRPTAYPAADFAEAWKKVLLYSEHTWGAWCSVSDPEAQATREQWDVKQSYALDAARRSHSLLDGIVGPAPSAPATASVWVVHNTTSWPRTELVTVPASAAPAPQGSRVLDGRAQAVPSQRLANGDLAFLAGPVAAYASASYRIASGDAGVPSGPAARAEGVALDNGRVRVQLDPRTGTIVGLTAAGSPDNLVDTSGGGGVNDYLFLPGDKLADLKRNGPVRIRVKETGPLVASLEIESEAPGCRKLVREVRLNAASGQVELVDLVDKERAATPTKPNDWQFAQKGGKESLNFGFAFQVPEGQLRLDLPIGVMRPEADQMPSACKNWFTVGRWADVSNRRQGVCWVSLDAPLVQVGGITATLVGSQSNPDIWRKKVEPTQKFYSWAMNNHWGTNYRSYQEGPVVFRFLLRPHGPYDAADNTRFAIGASQPLLVRPAGATPPTAVSRLTVEPADVVVTGFKPSDDGKALIVRLYGASDQVRKARLTWSDPVPRGLSLTDTSERPGKVLRGRVAVPAHGVVAVRAELP